MLLDGGIMTNKKMLLFAAIFILLFSTVAYADNFAVEDVKDVLKSNLYAFFKNPANAKLSLGELKSLLSFYLTINENQVTVNAATSITNIITKGENLPLPKCSDGTEYGECSSSKKYCVAGSLIERCKYCGCPANSVCQNEKCAPAGGIPPSQTYESYYSPTTPISTTFQCNSSCIGLCGVYNECGEYCGDCPYESYYSATTPISTTFQCNSSCIGLCNAFNECGEYCGDCPYESYYSNTYYSNTYYYSATELFGCAVDTDCGLSYFSYWCSGNQIVSSFANYTCVNPGTDQSICLASERYNNGTYCNPALNLTCVPGRDECVSGGLPP
ncbi:MAG: hypothetical protein V1702_05655 [Candidatus Woesearchaeota archaeon]